MKTLVLLFALSGLHLTQTFVQTTQADEAAIRQVLDDMQLTFDKRDISAVGSHFV